MNVLHPEHHRPKLTERQDPTAAELLATNLRPLEEQALRRPLEALTREAEAWLADNPPAESVVVSLSQFLLLRVTESRRALRSLDRQLQAFEVQAVQAITTEDRTELILETARSLGASDKELREDARALSRWLDEGAILDRFARQRGVLVRTIEVLLGRFAAIAEHAPPGTAWRQLSPEEVVRRLLDEPQDDKITAAALAALAGSLQAQRRRGDDVLLDDDLLQRVVQLAQDDREDDWVQCRALDVLLGAEGLSEEARPEALLAVLEQRLTRHVESDSLFVRRHAIAVGERLLSSFPPASVIIFFGSRDPSPAVRQRAAEALPTAPADFALNLWERLLTDDEPVVRISATRVAARLARRPNIAAGVLSRLGARLESEPDPLVTRAAIRALVEAHAQLESEDPTLAVEWRRWARGLFARLRAGAASVQVRRDAAAGSERLWLAGDASARAVAALVGSRLPRPGQSRRFRRAEVEAYPPEIWGRTLAVLSQADHCLDLERTATGYRLHRGFRWRFRLWRLLHELRNPAPDKRQAYRHTVGRVHYGDIRAPSRVLAELAETKVPGEPLFDADEGGWRPFVPLLDDFIATLNQPLPGRATCIYSSEGVTRVAPPPTLAGRARAYLALNWRFAETASLRNWSERSGTAPRFVEALRKLGFRIDFEPRDESAEPDDTVLRHFPAIALPLDGLDVFDRFARYALSLYENSLLDLGIFIGATCAVFVGRHWWQNRAVRKARSEIPLSIGGWGTRGKSSVERLKAALLNGIGHSVVSKTTGCEAMLLLAPSYGNLKEIFLFRPYDKATIWEQANVLRLAAKLRCDTLLWECMGLTPQYVEILQRQWMRDDLATLTNTYPDHEDIQGPAGIDIPKVMTLFIPERSTVLTSEEQMLPILREEALQCGTAIDATDWLDAAVVPPDVLARFPYDEHPYNIALLLRIADALGLDRDFALKEMADRVVPDLGVLKTYPRSRVDDRTLRFSNGMSANERHGCLSNWSRLGLDQPPDPAREWVVTVVNNRADRIPRSKVFAKILVEDIYADRHVLIGGNLAGLRGYIEEALDEWLAAFSLEHESQSPEETLLQAARRLRLPLATEDVVARLAGMLGEEPQAVADLAASNDVEAPLRQRGMPPTLAATIEACHRRNLADLEELQSLLEAVRQSGDSPSPGTTERCRTALREWFLRSLVVVENYYASGDEIVRRVAAEVPPGYECHVIGLQNIKGTGLDFVYRWQAWEQCARALEQLRSEDERVVTEGLRALTAFQELGVLCEHDLRSTFAHLREHAVDTGGLAAQLDAIEARLDAALSKGSTSEGKAAETAGRGSALAERLWGALETVLDAGDAVRRRKTADRIYADLATQRISIARAAVELKELTKRQKGGWLKKSFDRLRSRASTGKLDRSALAGQ